MTRLRVSLRSLLWLRLHAAFDHRQLRDAHAEDFADLAFDFGHEVGVVGEELLGIFTPLADADGPVREPRARLLDDLVLDPDVDQLAGLGDALAVTYIELRLAERCGAFVLDDFHFDARADDFLAFLDLVRAADVEAHRRVELQRAAARRR